jgi:predicted SAM-dependent methyltransferase
MAAWSIYSSMKIDEVTVTSSSASSSRPANLQELLEYQDWRFIEAAYDLLLARKPDKEGYDFYTSRIRSGVGKIQILKEISSSPEAISKGRRIVGLQKALRMDAIGSLPIVGGILRRLISLDGNSKSEVRLRILEQRNSALSDALPGIISQQTAAETRLRQVPQLVQRINLLEELKSHNIPSLAQSVAELGQRQSDFETHQLPTLLQTLSDINHRQLASDSDRDNLTKSVPVALRKVARELVEIHSAKDSLFNTFEIVQREYAAAADVLNGRLANLENVLASTTNSARRQEGALSALDEKISRAEEQTAKSRDEGEQKISALESLFESRYRETGSTLQDLVGNVGYLLSRVEFVRRELMFEMRYGAETPTGEPDRLTTPTMVISEEKLEKMRKTGIRLNLGCGHVPLEGFLNIDRRRLPGVDIVAEVDSLPFDNGDVAEIFSAHLIEHFPQEQLRRVLLVYWLNLLVPGGRFRAVAPDAQGMMTAYFSGAFQFEQLREVTFGGQDYDGDFHFNMMTTSSITALLKEAGYVDIVVEAENRANGNCKEFEISAMRPLT